MTPDFRSFDDLVADAVARVKLDVEGEMASITFAEDRVIEVPLAQVHVQENRLWVQVPGPLSAEFLPGNVSVVYPVPAPQVVAHVVSQLPPELVAQHLQHESQVGSMEDPMALIALRAVCSALLGAEIPPESTDSSME